MVSCSLQAKALPADIKAIYDKKRGAARLRYIEMQLDPAVANTVAAKHSFLLNKINEIYPGLIDAVDPSGVGVQDDLFLPTGEPSVQANQSPPSEAVAIAQANQAKLDAAAEKINEPQTETKVRRKKRGATAVLTKEQPGGTRKVGSGTAALKRTGSREGKKPKNAPEAVESESVGSVKSQQTVREGQQPNDLTEDENARVDTLLARWRDMPADDAVVDPGNADATPVGLDSILDPDVEEDLGFVSGEEEVNGMFSPEGGINSRGKLFDTNGKSITDPVSLGNAKKWASATMAKLNKANIFKWRVYKNVAEMKRKDPDLYAQAVASREDGKAIPERAAGYAYADRIAIFSDNIATKKQLAFTIAHEAIGHFGLGSIMPRANFTRMMDDIYARDAFVRREADLLAQKRGMDRHEAIEEVLADAAARLDTSLVARIYNAIKRFMNALGVSFHDDMTRYFLHHSRRYQRLGITPDASPYAVLRTFKQMDGIAGRASPLKAAVGVDMENMQGGSYQGMTANVRGILSRASSLAGLKQTAKNGGRNVRNFLKNVSSADNVGLSSLPFQEVLGIMMLSKERVEFLNTEMGEILAWANRSRSKDEGARALGSKITDFEMAPTDGERAVAGRAAVLWNRFAHDKRTDAALKRAPSLYKFSDGTAVRDEKGWDASRALGNMTIEQLNAGFDIQTVDKAGRTAVNRRADDSIIFYDEKGNETLEVDENGKSLGEPKRIMEHVSIVDNSGNSLKVTPRIYRLMQAMRDANDTVAEAVLLDKVSGAVEDQNAEFEQVLKDYSALGEPGKAALKKAFTIYSKLYKEGSVLEGSGLRWKQESIDRANNFIHHAARLLDGVGGKDKFKDWDVGPPAQFKGGTNRDVKAMAPFLPISKLPPGTDASILKTAGSKEALVAPVIAELMRVSKSTQGKQVLASDIATTIRNMYFLQSQIINADLYAKNTLQTAYIPLKRRGKYQVRVQAFEVDTNGDVTDIPVVLPALLQAQLYYTRMNGQGKAGSKANELNAILGKQEKGVELVDDFGQTKKVAFRALWDTAPQGASMSGSISYDDLASVLVRAGIQISPTDRQRLVELTANEHSTARTNLQKDFTPGWDPNVLHGVAEHIQQQAHIAAKNLVQHKIARLMVTRGKHMSAWSGDIQKLKRLQSEWLAVKAHGNEAATREAFTKMVRFQWQHIASAPVNEAEPTIRRYKQDGTFTLVTGEGGGQNFFQRAKDMVSGFHKYQGTPATGDEALAAQSSWAMSFAATAQLGFSVAAAMVNTASIVTHSTNFLATFNEKTGYGGGHGFIDSSVALQKAGHDLGLIRAMFNDGFKDVTGSASTLQKIVDRLQKRIDRGETNPTEHGLHLDEAQMLTGLTARGVLTPNMFRAVSDLARSGRAGSLISVAMDKWMFMFSKTEQYNRRVTALASYRLDKARMDKARGGKPLTAEDTKILYGRATDAVNYSQGNYDSFNRPAWAQGSVIRYLWMYKQFQVITVQLMANLSRGDRIRFIGMLALLSGLKGIPFMDDLWDLIDTLMQQFGIPSAGVEAELSLLLDDMGISSTLVMRGFLDFALGFTASTRLGMGDLVPLTGALKANADLGREFESLIGPVYGAFLGDGGLVPSIATIAKYTTEAIGINDDVTSAGAVFRSGLGLVGVKNIAKGLTYLSTGEIRNEKGKIVAKEAGAWDAIVQLVGFTPSAVTDQYSVIRMTNQARDYAQAIKSTYIATYLNAGSRAEQDSVRKMVRDWNSVLDRDSPFLIVNFMKSVLTSRKTSELNAAGRNLSTLPTQMKGFGKDLLEARNLSNKGIALN